MLTGYCRKCQDAVCADSRKLDAPHDWTLDTENSPFFQHWARPIRDLYGAGWEGVQFEAACGATFINRGGRAVSSRAFCIPGAPGWFYFIGPVDTGPGGLNFVNHVVPGLRPLARLVKAEKEIEEKR